MGELSRSIFISPEAQQKYYAAGQDVGVPYGGTYTGEKFKEPAYQRQVATIEEYLLIAYKEGVLLNDDWVVQQVPERGVLIYWDMIDSDPAVFAATETLVGGVAKTPLKIKPCDTSGDAVELAEFIKFAFDRIDFVTMLQEIGRGEFTGFSINEFVYETDRWRGRNVLVPERSVRVNESKVVFDYFNRPKLTTLHNPIIGAFFAPSAKYIVYKRGSRPYGDALLKHAFQPYWYKRNGVMALAQYVERFGVPPIFARHTTDIEANLNLAMLQKLRSQGIGSFPRGLAGENPLTVLEPAGTSSLIMDRATQFFNDEIFRAILGSTRTMSDSNEAGAYSATEVHAEQTAERQQNILRRLMYVLNRQIIPGIVRLNFGIKMSLRNGAYVRSDHPLPFAVFENDDEESPDSYMNRVTSWRQAGIKALPISKRQFYKKTGFEAPIDNNDILLPSGEQLAGGNIPSDLSEMSEAKRIIVPVLREFFNENHDPSNGQFTEGSGGKSLPDEHASNAKVTAASVNGGSPITFENFMNSTKVDFTEVPASSDEFESFRNVTPNYHSPAWLGGSAYFYKGSEVYRYANHWGKFSSVQWSLKDASGNVILPKIVNGVNKEPYRLGKADLSQFKVLDSSSSDPLNVFSEGGTKIREFFNENHDEIGRFTFGDNGGEKKSATSSKELHTENGKYTDERQALHDKIVEHLMGTATAVAHPTVTILGGGTASGKSTLVKSGELNIKNAAKIDPDEIKAMIPEFGQKVAAGEHNAAAYVHEESSDVSQQAMVTALDRHLNVVLDGTGDGGYPKLEARIDSYREHGADRIVAEYVTRPVSEALERSHARGEETGRHVPDQVLRDSHSSVAKIFPQAVKNGLFNEARLWDNTGGKGIPKKIFEYKNGKSSIYDESRYDTFLKKADDQ